MTTWTELRADAKSQLDNDDSRWIIEEVSGLDSAQLALKGGQPVPDVAIRRVQEMIDRRKNGVPIQYVLGSWSFRGLELFVDDRVLIPRPETESLVEYALECIEGRVSPTIVDLGTGSGAIACAIAAEIPTSEVFGTDISADSLAVARANVTSLGISGRNIRLLEGNLYEPLPEGLKGEVDLVISNPPYIANNEKLPSDVVDYEPHTALFGGPEGLDFYPAIFEGASKYLRPDGVVAVEISPNQVGAVMKIAEARGFDAEVLLDLAGQNRVIRARFAE